MPQYIVYAQQVLYVERVIDAPDAEAAATIADQLVQTGMLQPVYSVEFENGVLCEVVEADVPTKEAPPTSTLLDVFGEPPSDAPAFGKNKLDFLAKSRLNTILFATEPRKIGKTWWVYAVYNSAFFPGGNATEMYFYDPNTSVWLDSRQHPRYDDHDGEYAGLPKGLRRLYEDHEQAVRAALCQDWQPGQAG